MKASELRLGNLIFNDLGDPSEVCTIGKNTIEVKLGEGFATCFRPKPIPLTEEWLLKFSFSETEMRPYSDQKAFIIGRDADRIIFSAGRLFKPLPDDGFICICYHCEFAHQLQNAFFAYKNEELELKFTHENHYL